jgi:hypothetical protein
MISRINRLLVAFVIIALSLYIVILNRESITIRLAPSTDITTSAGVIFIALFCLGILCTALVATFFGFRSYLRERRLISKDKNRESFYQSVLKARSALASGEWGKAEALWQQILRRDPGNLIARIELSRSLENSGNPEEALRLLDAARAAAPDNLEVLFRAAELNLALGNKTAAVDNLALILYQQPILRAAKLARDLSEDLGRIDDAIEYHGKLERLSPAEADNDSVLGRLNFKKLQKDLVNSEPAAAAEALKAFCKKNPAVAEAFEALSVAEKASGNSEAAAQALVKAAKLSKRLDLWHHAMELWISGGMPERALATARSATKEAQGLFRLEAELTLIRTYLELNMFEDARTALSNLSSLAKSQSVEISPEMEREAQLLRGICLSGLGSYKESTETLKALAHDERVAFRPEQNGSVGGSAAHAPPARLSTP